MGNDTKNRHFQPVARKIQPFRWVAGIFILALPLAAAAGTQSSSQPSQTFLAYTSNVPSVYFESGLHSDSTNTIMGRVYEDINKNHFKDPFEPGLVGFEIHLTGAMDNFATSDSNGNYAFHGLPAGTYLLAEVQQAGWWQSAPVSNYTVTCDQGDVINFMNFGNNRIDPLCISGQAFEDILTNGAYRNWSNEPLSGWHIMLNGVTYFDSTVNEELTTNEYGYYTFSTVWPGIYSVSEVLKDGWTQTYPVNQDSWHINIVPNPPGLSRCYGTVFGNVDTVSTHVKYRSFTSTELAWAQGKGVKHEPVPNKPDKDEFWIRVVNAWPDSATKIRIHMTFPYEGGLYPVTHGGEIVPVDSRFRVIDVNFPSKLAPGEDVTVHGWLFKTASQKVQSWHMYWGSDSSKLGPPIATTNRRGHPMPSAANLLQVVGNGLKVGLGGPHSVVHSTYRDVIASLFEKWDQTHTGPARCLDNFEGTSSKPIKNQQKKLPPKKHNNRLFAEAIALQANIIGSDLGVLTPGFGNLIFDDGTGNANPLNGLPIRTIAAALDTFMSSPVDAGPGMQACKMPVSFGAIDPQTLYVKIRMIDSSFSGYIDTLSFSSGLQFKGVRTIDKVPYLRFDSAMSFRQFPVVYGGRRYEPEQFSLGQNYPNPFNPQTTISFTLSQSSIVTLKIYNVLGQEVATLINGESYDEGTQEIDFDANTLPSGVYFYHLDAEGVPDEDGASALTFSAVKKMLLVK